MYSLINKFLNGNSKYTFDELLKYELNHIRACYRDFLEKIMVNVKHEDDICLKDIMLGYIVGQIGTKRDKSGTFDDRFNQAKMY